MRISDWSSDVCSSDLYDGDVEIFLLADRREMARVRLILPSDEGVVVRQDRLRQAVARFGPGTPIERDAALAVPRQQDERGADAGDGPGRQQQAGADPAGGDPNIERAAGRGKEEVYVETSRVGPLN